MITLDIAIGKHRRTDKWRNVQMEWTELRDKLRSTHRTAETYEDYLRFPKSKQDEIKDVGGFVGGYLAGGKRRHGSVLHRSVLTLDIDHSTDGAWFTFTTVLDCAACCYSTHKHKAGAERLRLVIPLARPVQPDEYVAIARKVAELVGINLFDDTTYQPERLMYYPSTSSDAEFFYDEVDGEWLDPDALLGMYRNWRDVSEWAFSSRTTSITERSMQKQGDPTEKPGIVGAFCREYDIHTTIATFLADVYEPATDGRYTYIGGSTSGGLVVYGDGLFAYSHHGTDPCSGKLCNAFDLVRLHRYVMLDEDSTATVISKLPSYVAMCDWAASLKDIRGRISSERVVSAIAEFKGILDESKNNVRGDSDGGEGGSGLVPIDPEAEWLQQLNVDRKGNFLSTIDNIYLMLMNDPNLKGKFSYDMFDGRFRVVGDLPWRTRKKSEDFTDEDVSCLSHYIEQFGIPFLYVLKALDLVKTAVAHHPVREYLDTLRWDGEPRLDTLFIDYLGAEDNEYVRSATRKAFTAAVARIYEPGTKYDNVVVLVGREGVGKSTILDKMAKGWFSDCLGDIHTKEGMESLRGIWIMEIAELASLKKADQDAIKRFISSTEDVFRPAYGRNLVRLPRQCIFIGTTNSTTFLDANHENRRFLPIQTGVTEPILDIWSELEPWRISQIWAEAKENYEKGERLDLTGEALDIAKASKTQHVEVDERVYAIESYLNTPVPAEWADMSIYERRAYLADDDLMKELKKEEKDGYAIRTNISAIEVYCELLGGAIKDADVYKLRPVHNMLKQIKFLEKRGVMVRSKLYGRQKSYSRIDLS